MGREQYLGVIEKVSDWLVNERVESKRLYMRAMDEGDFVGFALLYGDPSVTMAASHKTYGDLKNIAMIFVLLLKISGFPMHFAICRKEDDAMVGLFNFELHEVVYEKELDGLQGISLSFMINKSQQGKGYMTELLDRLLDYFLVEHDLDFVNSGFYDYNDISRRLHEKSRMRYFKDMPIEGESFHSVEYIMFRKGVGNA